MFGSFHFILVIAFLSFILSTSEENPLETELNQIHRIQDELLQEPKNSFGFLIPNWSSLSSMLNHTSEFLAPITATPKTTWDVQSCKLSVDLSTVPTGSNVSMDIVGRFFVIKISKTMQKSDNSTDLGFLQFSSNYSTMTTEGIPSECLAEPSLTKAEPQQSTKIMVISFPFASNSTSITSVDSKKIDDFEHHGDGTHIELVQL